MDFRNNTKDKGFILTSHDYETNHLVARIQEENFNKECLLMQMQPKIIEKMKPRNKVSIVKNEELEGRKYCKFFKTKMISSLFKRYN